MFPALSVFCSLFLLSVQPLSPLQSRSEEMLRRRRDEEVGPQRETQLLQRLAPSLKPLELRGKLGSNSRKHDSQTQLNYISTCMFTPDTFCRRALKVYLVSVTCLSLYWETILVAFYILFYLNCSFFTLTSLTKPGYISSLAT